MRLEHGTQPIALDLRDYSYHRTFGSTKPYFQDNFCVDIGLTMPDQNADGLSFGCTGYTQTDNLVDEMGAGLSAKYTYFKTCDMEGHPPTQGCQVRTSLDSTQVYGVQELTETTDLQAESHRGGQYFNVYDDGALDWFDGIRVSLQAQVKGASLASPWFPRWEQVDASGILDMPLAEQLTNPPSWLSWHNYACKGWKTINGVPYLIIKSWQGKNYGDRGWVYMSREIANAVFEMRGTGIFMQAHARPTDIYTIKIALYEYVLVYLKRIFGLIHLN